jgi:phosphotriesterase-related protein
MHVMTVRGPVSPDSIGLTTMHEHVFCDTRQAWWAPESFEDAAMTEEPLAVRNAGLARWNALGIKDNLYLGIEDFTAQVGEVADFKAAGGGCLVDLTSEGIHPAPATLKRFAEQLDLHVVAGCGFYIHRTHPPWLERASVAEIEVAIEQQVRGGLADTDVLPGIIGEIGTSADFPECEQRVVRAAARVAAATSTAMNVHTTAPAKHALRIVDLVVEEGLDPGRLIFSHLDEVLDTAYHRQVLSAGAVIGFDSFGCEVSFGQLWRSPTDAEKVQGLVDALAMGFEEQLVLGHDVSLKCQLKRFAGLGYDHVLRRIVPVLTRFPGVGQDVIERLLRTNPARLLARP